MSTDKPKKAVALRYRPPLDQAPRVMAFGAQHRAERILELAAKYQIPIREDAELVQALTQLHVMREIPEDLYRAAAQLLALIYRLNQKKR